MDLCVITPGCDLQVFYQFYTIGATPLDIFYYNRIIE